MHANNETKLAAEILAKLGAARAKDAVNPSHPPVANPFGVEGVDRPEGKKFRARIRYCDALTGKDVRLTLGRFDNLDDAAYAYAVAHVRLWGALSRYYGGMTVETLELIGTVRSFGPFGY